MRSLALIFSTLIHAGVGFWLVRSTPPVILPEQSVMQISMVLAGPAQPGIDTIHDESTTEVEKHSGSIDQSEPSEPPVKPLPTETQISGTAIPEIQSNQVDSLKEVLIDQPIMELKKQRDANNPESKANQTRQFKSEDDTSNGNDEISVFTDPTPVAHLHNPPPTYPLRAKRRGMEGIVLLSVFVQTNGHPRTVEVKKSSGHRMLDMAALKAVRKWRFTPATQGNSPVEASVEVPIEFVLS